MTADPPDNDMRNSNGLCILHTHLATIKLYMYPIHGPIVLQPVVQCTRVCTCTVHVTRVHVLIFLASPCIVS